MPSPEAIPEEPSVSEAPSNAGIAGTVGSDVRRMVGSDDEGACGEDELCALAFEFSELTPSETDAVDGSPSDVVAASVDDDDPAASVDDDAVDSIEPPVEKLASSFLAWFFSFARRF